MTASDLSTALSALRDRWGDPVVRRGVSVGALAVAPEFEPVPDGDASPHPARPRPANGQVVSTGFADLDAILGPGGLPRGTGLALGGEVASGRTTLALRLVAETQAAGSLVAWVDLGRSLDPVEAAARGVELEHLVVLAPESLDDGLAMAGLLLGGRAVDLLVIDLPERVTTGRSGASGSTTSKLERLGAIARRAASALLVLEPPGLATGLRGAVDEVTSLRLGTRRLDWIRLGRDVVGQDVEVTVERSRLGPPGRRATLRILYAEGGDRDACLRRRELLTAGTPALSLLSQRDHADAPPPSPLVPSPAPDRTSAPPRFRVVPGGSGRPRRAALG